MTAAARPPFASTTLAGLAELIGVERALHMSVEFGGRRLYIPHDAPRDHRLVAAIGDVAALQLGRRFGGTHVDVPLAAGKRAEIVLRRLVDEWTIAKIAEGLRVTERHVWQVLADYDANPTFDLGPLRPRDRHQGDLFAGFADASSE